MVFLSRPAHPWARPNDVESSGAQDSPGALRQAQSQTAQRQFQLHQSAPLAGVCLSQLPPRLLLMSEKGPIRTPTCKCTATTAASSAGPEHSREAV